MDRPVLISDLIPAVAGGWFGYARYHAWRPS
jgi:hypothetical protein